MLKRLRIRYCIFRRDIIVKRLVKQGVRGNELLDHPQVKPWLIKLHLLLETTNQSEFRRGYNAAMEVITPDNVKEHYEIAYHSGYEDYFTRGWLRACDEIMYSTPNEKELL